jgi:hypothetical protein
MPNFYVMVPGELPVACAAQDRQEAARLFARANNVISGRLAVVPADRVAFVFVSAGTTPLTITDET